MNTLSYFTNERMIIQDFFDFVESVGGDFESACGKIGFQLFGFACAGDDGRNLRQAQDPGEREYGKGDAELIGDV